MYILYFTFIGLVLPQKGIDLREENVKAVTQGRESQTASEPSRRLTKKEEPVRFWSRAAGSLYRTETTVSPGVVFGEFIITDSSPVRADDTSFTISSYDPAQKQSKLNSNLAVIQTWLQVNKLSPNVKKAKYFIIDSHDRLGNLSYSPEIANTYMYLVVDLDESLSYVGLPFRQYKYCQKKVSAVLGAIKQVRNLVTREIVIMIYKALIQPYFDYCSSVWGGLGVC